MVKMVTVTDRHIFYDLVIDDIRFTTMVHKGVRGRNPSCEKSDSCGLFGCNKCIHCTQQCTLINKYQAWAESIVTAGRSYIIEKLLNQNDFSLSSEKLLHMFDSYCKEKFYSFNSKKGAGAFFSDKYYDKS